MTSSDGAGRRPRLATVWLGGCSGCHMSFLDLDEWLFDLADLADIVYSPIADVKQFPSDVDVTLVEGAVTNQDNLHLAHDLRRNTRIVVSFGDCAVTGNVTSLRNGMGTPDSMLQRVYVEHPDLAGVLPREVVPALLPQAQPLHEVIPIDVYLPGCPPTPDEIRRALMHLLTAVAAGEPIPRGNWRDREDLRFG